MEPDSSNGQMPRPVIGNGYPVEAFNPLLRSLLAWNLVARVEREDGSHVWELTEAAQHRLDALTPPRRISETTLAYLDHFCSRCREQRLTHLVDGRYLCEPCQQVEAAGVEETQPVRGHPRLWSRHR